MNSVDNISEKQIGINVMTKIKEKNEANIIESFDEDLEHYDPLMFKKDRAMKWLPVLFSGKYF